MPQMQKYLSKSNFFRYEYAKGNVNVKNVKNNNNKKKRYKRKV